MQDIRRDSLEAITTAVASRKVFKPKELKDLFVKYHKWSDNKGKCSTKQRREGKEAHELIVLHNLKLVIKIAFEYSRYSTVAVEDLVSEGTIGLLRAVEKFKHEKGTRFSTYSSLWIKQFIRRYLSQKSRDIRIPDHVAGKIGKILRFIKDYEEKHGKKPDIKFVSKEVKVSKGILNDLINGGVLNLRSVDFKLGDDGNDAATFGEILADTSIEAPDVRGLKSNDVENLFFFLDKLTRRERSIIIRRFGMKDGYPETLEKIAESYGISRERVRQLQTKCIRRLKEMMGRKYQDNFFIPKYF